MGTLKGGETYTVRLIQKKWSTTGYNQGTNSNITVSYPADTAYYEISMWRRHYFISALGEVIDNDYGLVGHLKL